MMSQFDALVNHRQSDEAARGEYLVARQTTSKTRQYILSVNMDTEGLAGSVLVNEPMASHTSWRVGGPADLFYKAHDINDLIAFIKRVPVTKNIVWVGLGSNLLVRDGGIRGAVLCTHQSLSTIEREDDTTLRVASGVPCAKLARLATRQGLSGAEFFAGIPGTMGGALAMNAGAFGGETWDVVESVDIVDRRGCRRQLDADAFEISYRSVRYRGRRGALARDNVVDDEYWFLGAKIRLNKGDAAQGKTQIRQLLTRRSQTQPVQSFNAGSVFRNPPSGFAAQLIESAGLKGVSVGGARVSEQHANFIINAGNATAADIEALIEHVIDTVAARHGVRLQPEVRIVGDALIQPAPGTSGSGDTHVS